MAQLVQFNKTPSRHHARKKEMVLLINQTISLKKQQQSALLSQVFDNFENRKKTLLKKYLTNRMSLDERATCLAQRSVARRFVVELITLAAQWHKAIEEEIQAMILLAQKVASSVLNTPSIPTLSAGEKIELKAHLASYFNLQFLLPLSGAHELPPHFAHYFAHLSFLTVSQHDKSAQVKIFWHGESRMVAIDYVDLTWILNRASKTILKFEHQS